MASRRMDRLNSLLKEVISDVIHREVKNPHLPRLFTITDVDVSPDLQHAKVFVSVMGDMQDKKNAIAALKSAAAFIRVTASKEVSLRYFPELNFFLDESLEKEIHIEELFAKIKKEREERESDELNSQ